MDASSPRSLSSVEAGERGPLARPKWIPAFAGMTKGFSREPEGGAGLWHVRAPWEDSQPERRLHRDTERRDVGAPRVSEVKNLH